MWRIDFLKEVEGRMLVVESSVRPVLRPLIRARIGSFHFFEKRIETYRRERGPPGPYAYCLRFAWVAQRSAPACAVLCIVFFEARPDFFGNEGGVLRV